MKPALKASRDVQRMGPPTSTLTPSITSPSIATSGSSSTDTSTPKRFVCSRPECAAQGIAYTRKAHLNDHCRSKHSQARFVCHEHECDKLFVRVDDLRKHINRVHKHLRPFLCLNGARPTFWHRACDCGRAFATRNELNRHRNAFQASVLKDQTLIKFAASALLGQSLAENESGDQGEDRSEDKGENEAVNEGLIEAEIEGDNDIQIQLPAVLLKQSTASLVESCNRAVFAGIIEDLFQGHFNDRPPQIPELSHLVDMSVAGSIRSEHDDGPVMTMDETSYDDDETKLYIRLSNHLRRRRSGTFRDLFGQLWLIKL